VTGGETVSVVNTRPHHGNYSAIFTSNGEGGFENAYCHKSVTSSELFARGYFYVSQSGISSDLDRFFFIIFRSGNNGLAYAGWKRMGGVTKWCITMRDGTTYVDDFALTNPSTGRWYSVELHWKKDSANGLAEMWVDGTLVCSSYDMNTSAYGDISTVQIGLAELYSCSSTTVYCDCAKIANAYIGQEAQLPISFQDGFEAGDFTTWSGTSASPGENISVVSDFPHHGNYGARFATNGDGVYENAYCHKSVISNNLYVRGYFYVSQSGIEADLDRIFFIVFRSGTSGLAYAGWKRDAGEVKWCITVRDSTSYADIFSSVSPMTSRWYCIQLHLKKDVSSGLVEMWVDGVIVCSAENLNTAAYGDISIVQVGLAETYVHGATIAYSDCVEIAGTYRDMESARTTSSLSISVSKNPTTLKSGTLITGSLVPKKQATDISIWYRTA
jgi:sarcosine oxidase delta subunit